MTNPELDEWITTAPGVAMNPDGHYGLQCVDLADQYAQDIFGVSWTVSIGGVQGAKQILDSASDDYFIRTDNDPNNPNLIPSRGDIVVWGGSAINQWGHVAVVESADVNGMWVIQQDGFAAPLKWADGAMYSDKPAHRAYLPYYGAGTGMVMGWLTPRDNKIIGYKAPNAPVVPPSIMSSQRITGVSGANYRTEPTTDSQATQTFTAGDVLNFVGYVRGATPSGGDSNIWLKGIGGGYVHISAVEPSNIDGLPDLTPAPVAPPAPVTPSVSATQRVVGDAGVNYRKEPSTKGESIQIYNAGDVLDFKGYIIGENVNGNSIWFIGAYTGGYAWSGGFTNSDTTGLPNRTPIVTAPTTPSVPPVQPTPTPVPTPVITAPTTPPVASGGTVSPDGIKCVTDWVPAHEDNYQVGNFPALKDVKSIVVHQFGEVGTDIKSVLNYFQMGLDARRVKDPKAGQSSAQFAVQGKRIAQTVSIKNRAYHAGPNGNDFIGIETSPNQDAETIASVNKLLAELYSMGLRATLVLHKNVPGNVTMCGSLIDLNNYHATPVQTPTPTPVETPTGPSRATLGEELAEHLLAIDEIIAKMKK